MGGEAMPARTGEEYVTGLGDGQAEVYICGEQVKDVTTTSHLSQRGAHPCQPLRYAA